MQNINEIIRSFATPGGVVLVQHTRAAPVKGRASLPHATLIVVDDAAHHPGAVNALKPREFTSSDGMITAYFRREVLTATPDPLGNDPWSVIVDGVIYDIDSVQPWLGGGFWVATAKRRTSAGQEQQVWFGEATNAQVAAGAAALLATLQASAKTGFTPQRSFRFDLAAGAGDVVCATWPTAIEQPADAVLFTAIDVNGARVSVTPNALLTTGATTIAVLPKVPSQGGRLQYECT